MKKCLSFAILCVSVVPAAAELNMFFTNSSSFANSNVWITLQRGQNPATTPTGANIPAVTYGTNSFVWNGLQRPLYQ
jgi:hypothetical protein